jgi:ribose-phosphate pyrophosphokinase
MILFANRAAQHLAQKIGIPQGAYTIKQFSDGELYVRIDQDVEKQDVWVLASTPAPAENILELFFLCDALSRAGAHINLFVTYFAYARQTITAPGEACAAHVITKSLQNFPLKSLYIMHPHCSLLHNFLRFTTVHDINFFCNVATAYDTIAAPDEGAAAFAETIAKASNKELILLKKVRPAQEKVKIVAIDGNVTHKKILLVDDIISTGRTIAGCAHALKDLGAASVAAAASHGVFSRGSQELLEQSPLEHVFVTNTIPQESRGIITVVDTSSCIQDSILRHKNSL